MTSSLEQYLAELSDPDKPVVPSKLVNLSELSFEEMELFKTTWPEIGTGRRRQIVGWLEELQADDFVMDFDDVLIFCLDDPDSQVRVGALEALWACEEPSLINHLTGLLLGDAEHTVRAAAAKAADDADDELEAAMAGEKVEDDSDVPPVPDNLLAGTKADLEDAVIDLAMAMGWHQNHVNNHAKKHHSGTPSQLTHAGLQGLVTSMWQRMTDEQRAAYTEVSDE